MTRNQPGEPLKQGRINDGHALCRLLERAVLLMNVEHVYKLFFQVLS